MCWVPAAIQGALSLAFLHSGDQVWELNSVPVVLCLAYGFISEQKLAFDRASS